MTQFIKSDFGRLIVELIKNVDLSQREFYEQVGIKKPYFYDILSGRTSPPPSDLQFKMIKILNPSEENRNKFFELAGKYRNEIPVDIKRFLNENERNKIRENDNFKKMLGGIIDGRK